MQVYYISYENNPTVLTGYVIVTSKQQIEIGFKKPLTINQFFGIGYINYYLYKFDNRLEN